MEEVNDLEKVSEKERERERERERWEIEKAILYICNRSRNKGRGSLSRGWSTYIESSSFSTIGAARSCGAIAVSGNTITIANHRRRYWYHFYPAGHVEPFRVRARVHVRTLLSTVFLFTLKCFAHILSFTHILLYLRSHARSFLAPLLRAVVCTCCMYVRTYVRT